MLILQTLEHLLTKYLPFVIGVLPLLVAIVAGLDLKQQFGRWFATCFLGLAMFLGGYLGVLAYHGTTWQKVFTWWRISGSTWTYALDLSFYVDFRVAVMVVLTTILSFITHLYALAYMKQGVRRYIILTGGFVSAMLGFLMAEDLVTQFIGWEVMGWGSYLLISFWYHQDLAARNSTKVWLINQLGTMSLLIGILIIGSELGSFHLPTLAIQPLDVYLNNRWLIVARYCLVTGVLIKSAQLPWFNWLSSAMDAPIPTSALIHTATMVGAGIHLLVSLTPILGETLLTYLAYWGGLTAFTGAYLAITQQHIKQVLVYSTISQLGYVVMAVGAGASSIGLFHLVTSAFSKACLFLCIGVVLQLVHQEGRPSTMQHMGGLRKQVPSAFYAYIVASLSLIGVPALAGSLSKEAVLTCVLAWADYQVQQGSYFGYLVPLLGFGASFLTVIYAARQCYLVFMGMPRWPHAPTRNVSYRIPRLMQISILALAMLTLGFWYDSVVTIRNSWLLQRLAQLPLIAPTLPIPYALKHSVTIASVIIVCLGLIFLLSWHLRNSATLLLPRTPLLLCGKRWDQLHYVTTQGVLYISSWIAQLDYWVTDIGMRGIGMGYIMIGNLFGWLDRRRLDSVFLSIGCISRHFSKIYQIAQRGSLQKFLLWMLVGIGLLLVTIYWATHAAYCYR
ncbi:MAG: NADH-quinone oxidoreductase subunit 5 family protein [Bacteroidota bacterium]